MEYLQGQAYDGASNMSGAYNGAQAILLKEQPLAHYTHCISHCTNLAAGCISSLPGMRDVLSYLNELCKLASNTIKFRNIPTDSNEMSSLKKLRPLCPTRWTIRCSATENLLANYSAILAALRQFVSESTISTEQRSKASGILLHFSKGESYLLLKITYKVFFMLEKLAVVSQGRSANYDGVRECVQSAAEGIKEARNNFPQLYKEVDEFIDSCEDFSEIAMPRLQKKGHRSFGQTEHNLGKSTFEYFSRQCYEIFDTAAVKLQSRFDTSKPGLKAYCGLFNSFFGSVDDEIKQYPEINSHELKMELVVFTKRWKPSNFNEYLEKLRKSPEEVKAFFPNILGVVKLLLLKPVSSAECERSFSCLRRLKTWLRLTMTQKLLNAWFSLMCIKL